MAPVMLGLLICLSLLPVFAESGDPGNPLTTHVLDVSKGLPGRNIAAMLYRYRNGVWISIKGGITDFDGRMGYFLPQARFTPGVYKISYNLASYWTKEGKDHFHPKADIVFRIEDPKQHYHIPLLVSPFSYVTYRGS
eukprot:gene3807-15095_t